jgi:glycosyltransferase involved in cell wall biosynthesis
MSQIQLTGAEVYTATLVDYQHQQGHELWVMSDSLHVKIAATYLPMPLHQRSFWQRIKNVHRVRQFIKQHHIDLVHAHSRASIWVGYYALLGTKIPLISTIHGRQKSSLSKRLWNVYGDKVITICNNIKMQLQNTVKINSRNIVTIANPVNFPSSIPPEHISASNLVIVSRANGVKAERLWQLIDTQLENLLIRFPALTITIIGVNKENLPAEIQHTLNIIQQQHKRRVNFLGVVADLMPYFENASCIIGAGRVGIEASGIGRPIIAIGEAFNLGLITLENIEQAIDSNFADIAIEYDSSEIEMNNIVSEVEKALQPQADQTTLAKKIQEHYASHIVCKKIMDVYHSAIIEKHHPQHIPVLMYHKVLAAPEVSQHKTFVTCEQFAQHMKFLHSSKFTAITFKDYYAYWKGDLPITQFPKKPIIITFDDGYKNNLENAIRATASKFLAG